MSKEPLGEADISFWFPNQASDWAEVTSVEDIVKRFRASPLDSFAVQLSGSLAIEDPFFRGGGIVLVFDHEHGMIRFFHGEMPEKLTPLVYFFVSSEIEQIRLAWISEEQVPTPRLAVLLPMAK